MISDEQILDCVRARIAAALPNHVVRSIARQMIRKDLGVMSLAEAAKFLDDRSPDKRKKLAESLVQSLAAPFEPEKYRDTYKDNLEAMIEAKVQGQEVVTPPAAEPAKVRSRPGSHHFQQRFLGPLGGQLLLQRSRGGSSGFRRAAREYTPGSAQDNGCEKTASGHGWRSMAAR